VRHVRELVAREPKENYGAEEIEWIAEGLEVRRLFDAGAAREEALEILRTAGRRPKVVGSESLCEAWGILGAIQRSQGRYSSAAWCLRKALVVGGAGQVSTVRRTTTLQRVAYLISDQGDLEKACEVLELGRALAAKVGDWGAVGRLLVSTGVLLVKRSCLDEAIDAYERSLLCLPAEEWHGHFSAYQGLGVSWAYRGDLKRALEQLNNALRVLDALQAPPPIIKSVVVWLKAEILMLRNELPAAERDFRTAREIYVAQRMRALDIALVSLRLAKVLLLEGKLAELKELTDQMFALLGPIERQNEIISGVYAEFMNLSLQGELTVELLEGFYRKMHGDAEQAPPLLPIRARGSSPGPGVKGPSSKNRDPAG
jgi:tetratricopeptide (TPR) repeat protein